MIKRDIQNLCSEKADVLIIGGGIHGATIAYHAAKVGYRPVLVEKNDFCSATSANSLKILHGGLRYLQHLNIKRIRHSISARREMMRLAPYLVKPLPCMLPLYGKGLQRRSIMKGALFLNDCICWDQNKGFPADLHLPSGHIVTKEKCMEVISGLDPEELECGSVWHDVLTLNTERMVLEYILKSIQHGAKAANYAEVTGLEKGSDDLYSVSIRDQFTHQFYRLKTKYIVNAAGPWFEESLHLPKENVTDKQQWALALNVISRKKIFTNYAVALEGESEYQDKDAILKRRKRLYFFVPWRGYTMIGTNYEKYNDKIDGLQVKVETIKEMVEDINAIYPPAQLKYEDISFFHAGLLPMKSTNETSAVQMEKNSSFFEYNTPNHKGIINVKGVKYTTAPILAQEITTYLQKLSKPSHPIKIKMDIPIETPWEYPHADFQGMLEDKYGKRARHVLYHLQTEQDDDVWVDEGFQLLKAEVSYLIFDEMACKLSDIVFRRTGLGTADCPPLNVLEKLASYMGNLLEWDLERRAKEIEEVLDRYRPLVLKSI